jgi:hypothetical protein
MENFARSPTIPGSEAGSSALVFLQRAYEIVHSQNTDDVQVIVEYFKQGAILPANTIKDDTSLVSRSFSMWLSWRSGGVTANRAYLLESTIGLVQTMFSLDHQRVRKRQVAMQKNLLVGWEFEYKIDDLLRYIDIKHRKDEMLEFAQLVPADIAIIE